MRISLTASLCIALAIIHPVNMSFSTLPEDLEGSGHDTDSSGSGSGDWSEQVSPGETIKDHSKSKGVRTFAENSGSGTKNTFQDSSVLTFDNAHWPAQDRGSGFVIMANSKSFLENKEILDGVIAGGVVGAILAATVAAILIYKWQKKDYGGYILGQQRASDEGYHSPNREAVVV